MIGRERRLRLSRFLQGANGRGWHRTLDMEEQMSSAHRSRSRRLLLALVFTTLAFSAHAADAAAASSGRES
jgi:hypothetical protein